MFELVYLSYTLHLQTLLTCYTSHYIVAELSKCMRCSLCVAVSEKQQVLQHMLSFHKQHVDCTQVMYIRLRALDAYLCS